MMSFPHFLRFMEVVISTLFFSQLTFVILLLAPNDQNSLFKRFGKNMD